MARPLRHLGRKLRPFWASRKGWRVPVLCGAYLAAVPYALCGVSLPQNAPTTEDSDALLFATPTTHDHVGRVVVPVRINGQGPFRFIVDTGADHSTISPALVQLLGLKPETRQMLLQGITGSAEVSFVTVDRLEAGELTLAPTELPVVWADVMAGADGILGAAGLNEKALVIDFQRNRVAIARHVAAVLRTDAIKIHTLPATHGLITLEMRVGSVPVLAVLDTGSQRTLGNMALRNAIRASKPKGFLVQITSVYGATEAVETGEIGLAPPISIDTVRINDVAIIYGPFHIFKVWQLEDRPAVIIGMDIIGSVASLGIDFKNQEVYLTSLQEGNTPRTMPGNLGDSVQKR